MEEQRALRVGISPVNALTPQAARQIGALELAYVGDTVYDLYVRRMLIMGGGGRMKTLHAKSVTYVRAAAQAAALRSFETALTEDERDVVKRARNHSSSIPRHADPADYHLATALEALAGYLYLSGQYARLDEIMTMALAAHDAPAE